MKNGSRAPAFEIERSRADRQQIPAPAGRDHQQGEVYSMTRKLIMSLTPLLAVVAFAIIPAVAQGAVWEHCEKGKGTEEFKTHKCSEKAAGGGWVWRVIPQGKANAEQVKSHGRLLLVDATVISGQIIEIECAGNDQERIWNAFNQLGVLQGYDEITAFKNEQCKSNVGCAVTVTSENLPWPTELTEAVAGTIRDKISGIKVVIKLTGCVLATTLTYTGTLEPQIVNGNPTVAKFDASAGELKAGGTSKGKIIGEDVIEQAEGWAVRVHS